MQSLRHILVGTDFSPASRVALEAGRDLSESFHAALTVVHVHDPMQLALPEGVASLRPAAAAVSPERPLRAALEALRAELPARARVELLVHASPPEAIRIWALEHDVDLIVVASHGRTGLARLLVGSVSERILRHAPCSVLVVPSRLQAER